MKSAASAIPDRLHKHPDLVKRESRNTINALTIRVGA